MLVFGALGTATGCAGQTGVSRAAGVMEAWSEAHEGTVEILDREIEADLVEHCSAAPDAELDACLAARAEAWRPVEDAVATAAAAQNVAEAAVYRWAPGQGPDAGPDAVPPADTCRLIQ